MQTGKPVNLPSLVSKAIELVGDKRTRPEQDVEEDVMEFIRRRFVNFHVSRQFPLDVVEAVVRARFDDVVDAAAGLKPSTSGNSAATSTILS